MPWTRSSGVAEWPPLRERCAGRRVDCRPAFVNRSLRIDPDRLWAHLMAMAEVGATPAGGSNRQALSDEDAAGRDLFVRWAGIEPDMAPILLGSHLDT